MQDLRPKKIQDYIGQEQAIKPLKMFIKAMQTRGPSEHILFYGPSGIGKTTLAHIIAHELSGEIKVTSGAAIERSGDLAAILTNLKDNDVLFIDEVHRLPKTVEETLYPVLEEYILDIVIGKGPSARTLRLPVPKITIIGATTRLALLSAPLRERFGLLLRLDYYAEEELEEIIKSSSKILAVPLDKDVAREIAKRSRKTPRIANRILMRARDMLDVNKLKKVDKETLYKLFDLLKLDSLGLSDIDRKYLYVLGVKFQNHPVGVETLASALSEDKKTIEEFIEPYLLQSGFIKKTPKGRMLTPEGLKHMKIPDKRSSSKQPSLI